MWIIVGTLLVVALVIIGGIVALNIAAVPAGMLATLCYRRVRHHGHPAAHA